MLTFVVICCEINMLRFVVICCEINMLRFVVYLESCSSLSAPGNGTITCPSTPKDGDVCSYACDNGNIISGTRSLTCQSDGTWSGSPPTCIGLLIGFQVSSN